jgi:hypothetical protein
MSECLELDALMEERRAGFRANHRSRAANCAQDACVVAFAHCALPQLALGTWKPTDRGLWRSWGRAAPLGGLGRLLDHPFCLMRAGAKGPARWATRTVVVQPYASGDCLKQLIEAAQATRPDLAFVELPARWAWHKRNEAGSDAARGNRISSTLIFAQLTREVSLAISTCGAQDVQSIDRQNGLLLEI